MEIDPEALASLLANIDEVILTIDGSGTITFCNPVVRDVFGWAPEQLIGHSFVEFTHPDQVLELFEAFEAVVGRDLQLADDVYTWMLRAADGSYVPTDISVSTGPELAPFGGVAATLQPQDQREPLRNKIIRLVDNESRLVRLASILLSSEVSGFDRALDMAANELTQLMLVGRASVWRVNGDRLERRVVAIRDPKRTADDLPEEIQLSAFEELAGVSFLETREAILSPEFAHVWEIGSKWAIEGVENALAEAMVVDGRFLGIVVIENTFGVGQFDSTHYSAIRSAGAILGAALDRHETELELERRATTDLLTGMANRWVAVELIDAWLGVPGAQEASVEHPEGGEVPLVGEASGDTDATFLRPRVPIGIALLDLDRFKVVNESLGHVAGDRLLVAVAVRLQTAVEATGGILGRLGGDEFVAAWRDVPDIEATLANVRRLVASLEPPFTLDATTLQVTASIGVLHLLPGVCGAADALRRAEDAMYRAKSKGGNLVETDDEHHYSRLAARVREENELRAALAAGELEPWFQGEWDLDTGRLSGAEALVRWKHPRLGVRDAKDFVRLAEEMGVIHALGDAMLSACFATLAEWGPLIGDAPFVMRVNVSAMQLRDDSLLVALAGLLSRHRVDPTSICIELTESSLLGDPDAAAAMLARIRALDIGLAIDDFGTGYSSLLYLKRLPLTGIKIDQTFVAGLPDDPIDGAVVAAVVALAERLGVTATAEGVETEAQRKAVIDLGCHLAQGFLLSRPETKDRFRARLAYGAHHRNVGRRAAPPAASG
jgi:diguanylate cyclase (GGDEF)-like protein/PAS domain S-box-containing protein